MNLTSLALPYSSLNPISCSHSTLTVLVFLLVYTGRGGILHHSFVLTVRTLYVSCTHLHRLIFPLGYGPVINRSIVPRLVLSVLVVVLPPPLTTRSRATFIATPALFLCIRHATDYISTRRSSGSVRQRALRCHADGRFRRVVFGVVY